MKQGMCKIDKIMVKRLLQMKGICLTAVLFFLLINIQSVRADGSRDMYPADYFSRYASSGVTVNSAGSYRACLMSGVPTASSDPNLASPFPTYGTLKVYAKAGEHIYVASSAMTAKNSATQESYGRIDWRAPDGTSGSISSTRRGGLIADRAQELAGPNINGSTNGYDAYKITVGDNQEGVWEIDFVGGSTNMNFSVETQVRHKVDGWIEDVTHPYINAFDVSVSNVEDNAFIKGRVYANVLNMMMPSTYQGNAYSCEWYTSLYVLTNTGYLYEVKTNGQNGHFSTFFANNKGVQTDPLGWIQNNTVYSSSRAIPCYGGFASYKSTDIDLASGNRFVNNRVPTYDPRRPDTTLTRIVDGEEKSVDDITHKIFFCKPSLDMPAVARAVYGKRVDSTWLLTNLNSEGAPLISNLTLVGKESHLKGVLGPEGVDIFFEANASGDFLIDMDFGAGYTNRVLSGYCEKGENVIDWDGLDGAGKSVPVVNITLSGKLKSAEIHFPFFDLENNKKGLILNQLNAEWSAVERDTIYWDDSSLSNLGTLASGEDVLEKTAGTNSPGHRWNNNGSGRGNNRIIDTWTFAQGADRNVQNISAYSRFIDLGITSVSIDTSLAHVGELISYTLEVENLNRGKILYQGDSVIVDSDADSASVGVWFPRGGFVTTSVELLDSDDPTCRVARQPSSTEYGLGFISLKSGKRATLKVSGYATSAWAHNEIRPIGFIMRPGDYFEVDAKNLASDGMPLNPLNEYEGIENNNVMMADRALFLLNSAPVSAAYDTIVPAGRSVSGNVLNNDKDVDGDQLSVLGFMVNGSMGTLDVPVDIQKEGRSCGSFTLSADGSYTFTADASYDGAIPDIYYGVSDGFTGNTVYSGADLIPGMDTSRINIQVLPNHLPTVTPTEVSINRSGSRTWLPIVISDEDGDPLTISVTGGDAASYEVSGDSIFYVGPAVSADEVSTFELTVDDGVRAPVVTTISVTIRSNQAPTVTPASVTIYAKYQTAQDYLVPLVYTDPDGGSVTLVDQWSNTPSAFEIRDNNLYFKATARNTRVVTVTPYQLSLVVRDEQGVTATVQVTVNVSVSRNDVSPSNVSVVTENITYGDPLSDALVYSADCSGSWSVMDSVAGAIEWDQILPAGEHTVSLMFSPSEEGYSAEIVQDLHFNVLPRPITLTSASGDKVYDGVAFSKPTVSVSEGSFLGSESFVYSNFASLTGADTIDNTFSYAAASGTSLANYDVTVRYGSLIVAPRPITLSTPSGSKVYDGTPLTKPTVTVSSGSFVGVDEFIYSNFATITEAGSVDNTFSYVPAPGVTLSNYDVTLDYGRLTIEPFVWTGDYDIVLSGSSFLYDASEKRPTVSLKIDNYTASEEYYTVRYENNINAGDSAMVIVSPKEGGSVSFRADTAFFSIRKRSVIIASSSCEQVYDGNELTCHTIQAVSGDGMASGETFTPEFTASLTDVGVMDNSFQVDIDERNYNVVTVYGSLSVTPRPVVLSSENIVWSDTSFAYDGEAHCPTATITVDGLVMDPSRDYTISCTNNVEVGEKSAVASVSKTADGNFDFVGFDGYFSIGPGVVSITGKQVASKTYDGTTDATVTLEGISGVASGDDVSVEVSASFSDANAGTDKDVEITYTLTGADKDNYRLSVAQETYPNGVIAPLQVTLSWPSESQFAYDGTLKRVEATVTNAIGSDVVNVLTYKGNQATEIGYYEAQALSLDNSNYALPSESSFEWSILPVLVAVDVTLENVPFSYDQTSHEPGVTVKVGETVLSASDYAVNYVNNVDAGDSAMAIVSRKPGCIYFFATDTSYFSIAKRVVAFRSDSCEKVYDGTPLTCETATVVDPSQILPGDSYTVTFTGSQTNVGTSDNTFVVLFNKDNYQVDPIYGALTVTPKPIDILPSDIVWNETEFVYDGEPHCPTATITVGGDVLNPMTDYVILCTNNVKVGSDVAHIAVRSQDGGNFVFTDYEVNFSISPAVITITDSTVFEKVYDGDNSAQVQVNAVSFKAPGDSIRVVASGKYNNASAGRNKTVTINYRLEGPDAGNYQLAYNRVTYGAGVINKCEAALVWSTPDTFVYDGLKHGVSATVSTELNVTIPIVTTYENDSAVAAGRYVAHATGLTGRNFALPQNDSLVWVILPSGNDATAFELQQNTFTYDATSHPATFVVDSALQFVQGTDYVISYKLEGGEEASWTGFPPINSGVYDVKVTIYNPNYENTDLTGWKMTIEKASLSVTPSVVQSKVYDRSLDATVSVESLSGVIGGEDVSVSAVAQYDTSSTDASSIRVVYRLMGEDMMNYSLSDSVYVTDGKILPSPLYVEGTTIMDKSYDGTLNAVATVGALRGVIAPDSVSVSVSSSAFSSDTIGNGTDVYVTYQLSGPDAGNYVVKSDTVPGNILEPAVSFSWNVKDTVYGSAIVGVNPMVEVTQSLDGKITYFVDGVAVDSGYVIPVGTHSLLAQFAASGSDYVVPSGGNVISVSKKYIVLDAYDINPAKPYDGSDSVVSLKTDSLLVGVVGSDDVRLSSLTAKYNSAQVGANKVITVSFSLTGRDTANYAIESESLPGVIRLREVKLAAGDSSKVYDGTPLVFDSVAIIGDGFIEGDLLSVHATGSITEPGHVLNQVVFEFANDSVEDNYDIIIARGFLVVTKIPQEIPAVTAVDESILGLNDGHLLGLTNQMEMHDANSSTFEAVTRLDSLYAPGTYYIRFPESQYYEASDTLEVVILPGRAEFMVDASSSDTTRGTVTGAGTYLYQTNVSVEATALTGYHFVAWNDSITENPFSFVLTGDTSFVASFEPNQYWLYAMDRGVTLDSLSVLFGDTVAASMLSVTAQREGYDFMGWSPAFPLVMGAGDQVVEAQWKRKMFEVDVDTLTVGGRVAINFENPVAYGDTVVMDAHAMVGYHFSSWNDGNTEPLRSVVVTSDTSFSPIFMRNQYMVYAISDDVAVDTISVAYGDTVYESMLDVTLSKTGYAFAGWSPAFPLVMGASDQTVTAQWTRLTYVVSVDSLLDGGRTTTNFENPVAHGDTITLAAVPFDGHHFLSWSDGDLSNPRTVIVTSDSSFTPLFDVNRHLLYVMNNDTIVDSISIAYGDTITESMLNYALENVGYNFMGWSPTLPVLAGDSNMSVVAQWSQKMFIVTVDTLSPEGDITMSVENPIPYGTSLSLRAVAKNGYHFVAWTDGVMLNPRIYTVYKDSSFAALYAPNEYTLYVMSDADTLRSSTVLFQDTVTESTVGLAPEKVGYDFVGWSPELPIVVGLSDVTVTAQFVKKTFTVSVDTLLANGRVITDFENPVAYGDTVTLIAEPSEGYHFGSWNDGLSTNPRQIVVTMDTSFSPVFVANQYWLTVLNGADTLQSSLITYGDTVNESDVTVVPERVGYDFTGWQPSLPLVMGTAGVTVEAQWTKKMFELTLDTLFERGKIITDFENPVAYGDTITLTAVPYEGYHFVAWEDGLEDNIHRIVVTSDTSLTPLFDVNRYDLIVMNEDTIVTTLPIYYGDTIQDSYVTFSLEKVGHDFAGWLPTLPVVAGAGDVTIVAQWTKKKIELNLDTLFEKGKIITDFQNPVTYGDTITLMVQPSEGYHFLSWADGDTTNPRMVEIISDTTLLPVFMPNTYGLVVLANGDTLLSIPVTFGDSITDSLINVIPEKVGHDFVGWSPSLPIKVGVGDLTLEAQWVKKTYQITVHAGENGKVDTPFVNPVAFEDTIQFSAIPDEGFRFASWSDGDRSNPRQVVVTGDSSFSASFVPNVYYVKVVSDNQVLSVLPLHFRDSILRQSLDSLNPSKVGHDFVDWDVKFPLTMGSHDTTITAIYTPKIFTVVTKINGNVGKVSGVGDYPYGTTVNLQAIPNAGFHFVKWGNGDTTRAISFVLVSDTIVSTLFAKDVDEMMVDTLIIPAFGYCPNTEDVIRYSLLNSEAPSEYRILFSEEALEAGFVDVDFTKISVDNEVKIVVPDCPAGTYRASIQFKNAIHSVTPFFDVDLRVNLSSDYITDIWQDVVSVVNTENLFTEYQWFHNDVKVGGATAPYYCEKKGLSGNYYLEAVTTDGRQLRTCKKWFDYATNTTLSVYPNPTPDNATVELSVDNGAVHSLTVTNATGVVVISTTFVGRKTQISFREFAPGTYIVEVDGLTEKEIRK